MDLTRTIAREMEPRELAAIRAAALPVAITAKLAAIVDRATRLRAELAAIDQERFDLRRDRARVDLEIDLYKKQPHSGEVPQGWRTELDLNTQALNRLEERGAAIAARLAPLGALAQRAILWVKHTAPEVIIRRIGSCAAEATRISLPKEPAALRAELETVRADLDTLRVERRRIEATPVPLEEAKERLTHALDVVAGRWHAPSLGRFFAPTYLPEAETGGDLVPPIVESAGTVFRSFILRMLDDEIRGTLLGILESHTTTLGPTLTTDERAERLATLDGKVLALNVREELVVMGLETCGDDVIRREGADAAAVLCVGAESTDPLRAAPPPKPAPVARKSAGSLDLEGEPARA